MKEIGEILAVGDPGGCGGGVGVVGVVWGELCGWRSEAWGGGVGRVVWAPFQMHGVTCLH